VSIISGSYIASLKSNLSKQLIEDFEIQIKQPTDPDLSSIPILLLDCIRTKPNIYYENQILIIQESDPNRADFKRAWIEHYLRRIYILTYEENEELVIRNKIIEAIELYHEKRAQREKEQLALSYAQELIRQVSEQDRVINEKLEIIHKKNKELSTLKDTNKSIQNLAYQLISAQSKEEVNSIAKTVFPNYTNPSAQHLIDQALERIEVESQRRQTHTVFTNALKAIKSPILIVNKKYDILASNLNNTQNISKKCYEVLFARSSPCYECKMGQSFLTKDRSLLVISNSIKTKYDDESSESFFHLYQDQSDLIPYQIKVSENHNLNDLSVISASIAHELNNPLAGMLSYTQLLLMQIKPGDELFNELRWIEAGIKKARDIVGQLLVFSRAQFSSDTNQVERSISATIAIAGLSFYHSILPNAEIHTYLQSPLKKNEILLVNYLIKIMVTLLFDTLIKDQIQLNSFQVTLFSNESEFYFTLSPIPQTVASKAQASTGFFEAVKLFDGSFTVKCDDHSLDCELKTLFRRLDF